MGATRLVKCVFLLAAGSLAACRGAILVPEWTVPLDSGTRVPPPDGGSTDAGLTFPTVGTDTHVENLGAFPASRVAKGLGWNLTLGSEVEFKAAHEAGAVHGRVQCGWNTVEVQSPPPANTSQGYGLTPECASSLMYARQYGLSLTLLAGFGAPYHNILTLTASTGAPAQGTSLDVTFVSGMGGDTLASMVVPYVYVTLANSTHALVTRQNYPGALISAIQQIDATHATLTLASGLAAAVPAGTILSINQVLYPSAASDSASDPSVQAFVAYVQYLGSRCAAAGVPCDIELWNEPAWPDDCWDNRRDCFDVNPGYDEQDTGPNWGFLAAVQDTTPAAGVTYTWAGPEKSGDLSALSPSMAQYSGVPFTQPATAVLHEALHPYGNNPEQKLWSLPCLISKLGNSDYFGCNLVPAGSSNALEVMYLTLEARQQSPAYGLGHTISETGLSTQGLGASEAAKARYEVRQYLVALAGGLDWVAFYRLYEDTDDHSTGFSAILPNGGLAYTPLPAFTALAGVVADAALMGGAPLDAYAADGTDLARVVSYQGSYPLEVLQAVGTRPGDAQSSEWVTLFQRSEAPGPCQQPDYVGCWSNLAATPASAATLSIPGGLSVDRAVNLVSRAAVPFAVSGQQVTLAVSDDPVGLLLVPGVHVNP